MSESFELSRVDPGSLTSQRGDPFAADDGRMGRLFRLVFAAPRCLYRKVYWLERAINGKIRLRQVMNLNRANKKADKVVSMLPPNPDESLVRLAIAQANKGQWLTSVRWEVYGDFACTQLLLTGRFDHFDLFPANASDQLRKQIGTGEVALDLNPSAWDFDCLLKGHTCPGCGRQGRLDFMIYLPTDVHCGDCAKKLPRRQLGGTEIYGSEMSMARILLQRFVSSVNDGVLPAPPPKGEHDDDLHFIDFRATPLLCWVIQYMLEGRPIIDCKRLQHDPLMIDKRVAEGFNHTTIRLLFQHSIFALLKVDHLREAYIRFIQRVLGRYKPSGESRLFVPPSATAEEFAAVQDSWRDEGEEHAAQDLQVLSHLEDWLFGPTSTPYGSAADVAVELETKRKQVIRTVELYALTIEDMLDFKGTEILRATEEEGNANHG